MRTLFSLGAVVLFTASSLFAQSEQKKSNQYLGQFSTNKYDAKSTSNKFGVYGSKFSPKSIQNPYGKFGSQYSPSGVRNPYAVKTPKLFAADGTYLGKLSSNPHDPESISNPNGIYGSRYSPKSVNNPYGQYGSKYSPLSPNNPYTTKAPSIILKPSQPTSTLQNKMNRLKMMKQRSIYQRR